MVRAMATGVFGVFMLAGAVGLGASPALAEVMSSEGEVIEHSVREGDNLSLLAGYYYRNPRLWKRIYLANSSTVTDPNMILPGGVLKIRTEPAKQVKMTYSDFRQRALR